jgi:hypothetical protein
MRRLIVVAVLLPLLAMAETPVYRSLDKEGRVIYSPRPPADAVKSEEVAIPPPPLESEVQRAEEETRKRKEQLERLDQERRLHAAEEQERQRRELESMPVQQPQNWWPIPAIVTHPLPGVPTAPDAPPAPLPVR